ncbi:hypothetical protein [Caballeronia sp. LZ019]|uniref:hypothetical protein n=1 Tax=Caballeronia sp. LZ019 TaxID=3038555 RepID=UPI00285527AF|nr:hypothetical protein [Caballeronia sp. LZ019]MDR5808359.1 hypothetical protein [Caballeronia sp. LZ019]
MVGTFFAATFDAAFFAGAAVFTVAFLAVAFLAAVFAEVGMFLLPVLVSDIGIRQRLCVRINAGFYIGQTRSCESFAFLYRFFRGFSWRRTDKRAARRAMHALSMHRTALHP